MSSSDDHYAKYLTELSRGISGLWKSNDFTDITIQVEHRKFKCHKAILTSVSPYFQAMFSSGMQECHQNLIKLKEIDPAIFECILEYIYKGTNTVTNSNCEDLLHACVMFQIDSLQELCEIELSETLNYKNCLRLWKLSRIYSCDILMQRAWPLVLNGFCENCSKDDFLTLDAKDVVDIIKDDKLFVSDEEMVSDAVLEWLDFDFDRRKLHFSELLEHVRLPQCCPEYLIGVLEKCSLVKNDPECKELFDEARNFHMLPARQHEFSSHRMYPRYDGDFEDVLVVITDYNPYRSAPFHCNKTIACFSFMNQRWLHMASLPFDPGLDFAMITHGNDIYITGGHLQHKCTLKFEYFKNEWTECQKLRRGRYSHAMASVKQSIYVIGGYSHTMPDGSQVLGLLEEYHIHGKRWKNIGELKCPVESMSAAVVGERIYVYGGIKRDNSATNIIQYFDTRTRDAVIVKDELPIATKLTRTVTIDGIVNLITLEGILLKSDELEKGFELRSALDTSGLAVIGAIHHRNSIVFLLGTGTKDPMSLDRLLKYDMQSDPHSTKQILLSNGDNPKLIYGSCRTILPRENMVNPY